MKKRKSKIKSYGRINTIISLIALGFATAFMVVGIYETNKDIETIYMNELIMMKNNTYKNANLDIHYEPYVFAEYDDKAYKFYIVQDDEYMYIAYINDSLYEDIKKKDLEKEPFIIEGHTQSIPDDVKKLAIDAYNEVVEREVVTDTNFESYFGSIYLDTSSMYNLSEIYYIISIVLIIFGAMGLMRSNKKVKKVVSNLIKK